MNVAEGIINQEGITTVLLGSINTGVIALAVFELALVVKKEYASPNDDEEKDAVSSLRETLPRFIGMVCVALSLEGLIMVIKYSQLELAGNLYYPRGDHRKYRAIVNGSRSIYIFNRKGRH